MCGDPARAISTGAGSSAPERPLIAQAVEWQTRQRRQQRGENAQKPKTKAKSETRKTEIKKLNRSEVHRSYSGINMWLTLLVGALVALLGWDYLRKRHSCDTLCRSGITGPLSLPVLGCGLQALQLGAESEYKLPFLGYFHFQLSSSFLCHQIWLTMWAPALPAMARPFACGYSTSHWSIPWN